MPTVGPQTATVTRVGYTTSAGTILATGSGRKRFIIVNEGASNLYLLFGGTGTVTITNYSVKLTTGQTYEQGSGTSTYAGPVTGIGDGSGNAQVTFW